MSEFTIDPTRLYVSLEVPLDGAKENYAQFLSSDEIRRADDFRRPSDRISFLTSRALIRKSLSRHLHVEPKGWRFKKDSHGRPYVIFPSEGRKLKFSVSHTDAMVACAITFDRDVGIDVERMRDFPKDVLANCFSATEVEAILRTAQGERSKRSFELWTLKEAYLKARGVGLSMPLDQFSFRFDSHKTPSLEIGELLDHRAVDWKFRLLCIPPTHIAACCVFSPAHGRITGAEVTISEKSCEFMPC
jgi:4'-phosphopantetheinyl transferase